MAAAGGWSSLPGDLLKEVSGRLSSDADSLHIHQVCPNWSAFTVPPEVYRPWLIVGRKGRSGLQLIGEYSLRLLRGDAPGTGIHDPPAGFPYCCGTSRGWLALVDDDQLPTRLVLWEPLSNTEISLPCLRPLTWIFLSDDPLTSADWIVIASQLQGMLGQRTLFWRPGDASWSILNGQGTAEIDTVTFLDGKAYYIDIRRNIIVCDFNSGTDPCPKFTPIFHVYDVVNRLCKCDILHVPRGVHLVACKGELLLVMFYLADHPSLAEVYKALCTTNKRLELRERVLDLGDYSLFVGRGDTFALSAKEFPAVKRNCIYYTGRPFKKQYWISVFHLESGVLEEIPYPEKLKQDTTKWIPHTFFCPRKSLVKQQ